MNQKELEAYRQRCFLRQMTDPYDTCFKSGVMFKDIIVQENSRRMYAGSLQVYNQSKQLWRIVFPAQGDNAGLGTWKCDEEGQLADLQTLQVLAADLVQRRDALPEAFPKPPPGCVACHVSIQPILCPTRDEYHTFWVSQEHYGMEFIFKKLDPLMLSVKGKATDLATIQRCASQVRHDALMCTDAGN